MKDQLVSFDENKDYYILDEMEYLNKKYILGIGIDKNQEIIKDDYMIVEIKQENGDSIMHLIEDINEYQNIQNKFMGRIIS